MRNLATRTLLLSLAGVAGLCLAAQGAPGPQRGTGNWINPRDAADLDFDGYVDDADFILFSLQYDVMECDSTGMPEECSADLNHDGLVDDADFVLFVHEYSRPIPVLS